MSKKNDDDIDEVIQSEEEKQQEEKRAEEVRKIQEANSRDKLLKLKQVIFAPVIEEFMFRGIITGIYVDAGTSEKVCIWILPLYFAYAHVHALYK